MVNEANPAQGVIDAIEKMKEDIANGIVAEVMIDTDSFRELDELDRAAIEQFFREDD